MLLGTPGRPAVAKKVIDLRHKWAFPSFLACVMALSVRKCGPVIGFMVVCRCYIPHIEESPMAEYIPSPREWVRDQVEIL